MPNLRLLAKGKVRDIYEITGAAEQLLFVATDRISAFDVIMENVGPNLLYVDELTIQGVPEKGINLTTVSLFWFDKLSNIIPNHVVIPTPSSAHSGSSQRWSQFPSSLHEYRSQLEGRSMIVRKCEVIMIEAIVRGYITGEQVVRPRC